MRRHSYRYEITTVVKGTDHWMTTYKCAHCGKTNALNLGQLMSMSASLARCESKSAPKVPWWKRILFDSINCFEEVDDDQ